MPEEPTPGECAYTAWEHALHAQGRLTTVGQWASLGPQDQAAWEAVAQAVLEYAAVAQARAERDAEQRVHDRMIARLRREEDAP